MNGRAVRESVLAAPPVVAEARSSRVKESKLGEMVADVER